MADSNKQTVYTISDNQLTTSQLYQEDARIKLLLEQKSKIDSELKAARGRIGAHLSSAGQEQVQVGDNIYYTAASSYGFETTGAKIVKKHAEKNLLDLFKGNGYEQFVKSSIDKATIWNYYQTASAEEKQELDKILSNHGLTLEQRTTLKSKTAPKNKKG